MGGAPPQPSLNKNQARALGCEPGVAPVRVVPGVGPGGGGIAQEDGDGDDDNVMTNADFQGAPPRVPSG